MFSRALMATALALPVFLHALDASAVAEKNVGPGLSIAGAPLAVHGYDVVAFFTDGKPLIGSDAFVVVHEGAAYRFASEAHAKTFKAGPERYLPQYGGYCAFGTALSKKFDGDPRFWSVIDGKLYLNLNEEIAKKFNEDQRGAIAKADAAWPKIKDKDPLKL